MSLDIKAFKTLIDNGYGLDSRDEISSFTFSHRLNDYWGAKELFTSNYDELMPAIKYNLAFDTYVYFRETIKRLKQINDENNFGDDVTEYLKEILESNADIIYMQIF